MGYFIKKETVHSILSRMPEVEPPAFLLENIAAATVAKKVPAYTRHEDKYAVGMAVA